MSIQSIQASAKRALKNSAAKAKRGDVFLLEHTTVWTAVKTFEKTTSQYYILAKATRVNREGVVTQYRRAHCNYVEALGTGDRVLLITDPTLQGAARDLFDTLKDDYFPSADRAKSAILDRAEALR